MGAVASGMSPNLRRSFSSSDLTRPQTLLLWKRTVLPIVMNQEKLISITFFSELKKKGKKIYSLSLRSLLPGTDFLQFFSGLDPRLKECLQIPHLNQYYVEKPQGHLLGYAWRSSVQNERQNLQKKAFHFNLNNGFNLMHSSPQNSQLTNFYCTMYTFAF